MPYYLLKYSYDFLEFLRSYICACVKRSLLQVTNVQSGMFLFCKLKYNLMCKASVTEISRGKTNCAKLAAAM